LFRIDGDLVAPHDAVHRSVRKSLERGNDPGFLRGPNRKVKRSTGRLRKGLSAAKQKARR
jgi:hypothetical protein